MADKKYFWLKLKKDFFKRHDIFLIESRPNGKEYILLYLKLLLESIDHDGDLRFSETIPYNEEMLSVITNTNVDVVKGAMKLFKDLNMIEILDNSTIYMNEVNKMLGSETYWAEKKRKERLIDNNVGHCPSIVQNVQVMSKQEKELDKELDIELNKDIKPIRKKYGEYKNVLFTEEQYEKLLLEFPNDYNERIENLSGYMASTGKSYKDHLATVRNWSKKELNNSKGNERTKMIEKALGMR